MGALDDATTETADYASANGSTISAVQVAEAVAATPAIPAIGVTFSDLSDGYGLSMLSAIQDYGAAHELQTVLRISHGDQAIEEVAIQTLVKFGVQGVIIMPVHGEYYNSALVQLVFSGFLRVLVDRRLNGIPASAAFTDNQAAAQELTEYLIKRGHRHITFISPPAQNTSSIEERIQGYKAALTAHRQTTPPDYVLSRLTSTMSKSTRPETVSADSDLLKAFILAHPEVTGFVACEYNIALLLQRALREIGKHVPNDGAIVCFDTPDHQFSDLSFTHIQQDEVVMGQTAVDLLLGQITSEFRSEQRLIDFTIVPGTSS